MPLVFDPAPVRRADFSALRDFNGLDGGLCDAFGPRDFEGDLFADDLDGSRVIFSTEDFGDFLRVFLDIRLPFVAFRGSIIEVLRQTGIRRIAGQASYARSMLKRISTRHPSAR